MDIPSEKRVIEIIKRRMIKKKKFYPFIEVGCGDGFNLKEFSKMGLEGIGVDISKEAIKIAKSKKLKNIRLINEDFLKLKTKTNLIFMLSVLEHIKEDISFLKKANNLLMDKGILVIAVPANSKAYGFADMNAGHYRRYDKDEIKKKLKNTGFKIDEIFMIGFPVSSFYTWFFNYCHKRKSKNQKVKMNKNLFSGIENKENYYPNIFQKLSKIAFPILSSLIKIDRFFLKTNLGNGMVIFARKTV
ncbi:MAG: class I SAM-dependent methyltransferase [Nanoarchaeota archaeon]|nr:class I SAM-dependent methyltransferase [Nanoarchaeota archaeon]